VIRVLVSANSAVELAGLEAMVNSAPSLELVGSNLGQAGLDQQLADTQPDVLLQSAGAGELDRQREWPSEANSAAIVVLASEPEFQAALAAIQDSSVAGVLPAWASPREIRAAVEAAAAGLIVVHPDVAEHLWSPLGNGEEPAAGAAALEPSGSTPSPSPGLRLSPRETEILNLLAAGLGNKEIAWRLKISEHTVKFHVTSIFNKLNASGRAEAVAIGIRHGLIVL
jgi:two-component system, NarL family, response regulator YdfI